MRTATPESNVVVSNRAAPENSFLVCPMSFAPPNRLLS
jgi:hypothetical protein